MSSDGFHVHGPHDHELEHAAHGGNTHHDDEPRKSHQSLTSRIAVFTAIIATVGAIFSYMGGATQADAGLYKNTAAIKKTEAANRWGYFQAKSTKQAMAEMARDLASSAEQAKYQSKIDRYELEKTDIKKEAETIEEDATEWDHKSDESMHQHHRWAQATTALQVAIALAAMALLTRKKWLEYGMFAMAVIGIFLGGLAALHV